MKSTNILRFSGWALVLAAIFLLVSFRPGAAQLRVALERFFGMPASAFDDETLQALSESVGSLPFLCANVLITFGLVGIRTRYGERTGSAGKLALAVGILGGVTSVVSCLLVSLGIENSRYILNLSMAVMFGGLFAFGVVALFVKPLPHGNGLPALAGIWWVLIVLIAYGYQLLVGHGLPVPHMLSLAIFLCMSASLAWLGYVLQADGEQTLSQTMNRQFTEARK